MNRKDSGYVLIRKLQTGVHRYGPVYILSAWAAVSRMPNWHRAKLTGGPVWYTRENIPVSNIVVTYYKYIDVSIYRCIFTYRSLIHMAVVCFNLHITIPISTAAAQIRTDNEHDVSFECRLSPMRNARNSGHHSGTRFRW